MLIFKQGKVESNILEKPLDSIQIKDATSNTPIIINFKSSLFFRMITTYDSIIQILNHTSITKAEYDEIYSIYNKINTYELESIDFIIKGDKTKMFINLPYTKISQLKFMLMDKYHVSKENCSAVAIVQFLTNGFSL